MNKMKKSLILSIALLASVVFGFLTITLPGGQAVNGVYVTFAFLTSAFAPKVAQEALEEKVKTLAPSVTP